MKTFWREFSKMLIKVNPLFVLCLGNCPALMMTIGLDATLGMAVGLAFVMLFTNLIVSSLRNVIPNVVRIPVFVCIGATFVTMVDLFFHGYVPAIWALLGIYLPLITVNWNVLGRAEVFGSHNPTLPSIADGLGTGFGFGLAMLIVAIPRIFLGKGVFELFGKTLLSVPVLSETPVALMVLPPGAFLVIGLLHGLFRRIGVEQHE